MKPARIEAQTPAVIRPNLPASVARNLPDTIEEARGQAMACRRPEEAAEHPTLATMAATYGEDNLAANVMALLAKAMEAVNMSRRITPEGLAILADGILEDFSHETLADVAIFARGVALGKWGEPGKEGKAYAGLDVPTLMAWWRQYLGAKAEAMERLQRARGSQHLRQVQPTNPERLQQVHGLLAQASAQAKAQDQREREARQLRHLVAYLPSYTDEQLRQAWSVYSFPEARQSILAEAEARGLEIRKPCP